MIEAILSELEALKAKVDGAIQHVKSGVTTLNEDQQEELKRLVNGIEDEACNVSDRVHRVIYGVETKTDTLVAKVGGFVEELKDKVESFVGLAQWEPTVTAAEEIDAGGDGFGEGNDPSGNPFPPAIATDEPTDEPPAAA